MLRRLGIVAVLSLIVVALTASVALANHRPGHQPPGQGGTGTPGTGNPHYVVEPIATLDNGTVTVTGSIAGLGNQPIDAVLTVRASQEVQCRNPGGNIAPGQTQTFTATDVQEDIRPESGRANFEVSATPVAPEDLTGACPNPRWTAIPGDVVIESATLQIFQAGEELTALQRTFTSF